LSSFEVIRLGSPNRPDEVEEPIVWRCCLL
jgi:hypothetical protein